MEFIRHGEVLLEKVKKMEGKKTKKKSETLAVGTVTGHKHVLKGELTVSTKDGKKFVKLKKIGELTHEEHNTLKVPKGIYEVKIQREVDLQGEQRYVAD